uniref:Uncharacterized protein n=1 Tax=Escherichia coli TaxID=562 RepID=A0A6G9ZZ43_ECOLX|nr:hypothetical protein [Escherichia coli]
MTSDQEECLFKVTKCESGVIELGFYKNNQKSRPKNVY